MRLSVRTKLAGSYAVLVGLVLIVTAATAYWDWQTVADLDRLVEQFPAGAPADLVRTVESTRLQAQITLAFVFGGSVLAASVAVLFAYLGSRDILHSLRAVRSYAEAVAEGKTHAAPRIRSGDEFENMSRSLEKMDAYLRQVSEYAEQVAAGDLDATIEARSPHDRLGNSLAEMAEKLRLLVRESARAESLRRSEAMRRRMLRTVSHEFRTPIGLIKVAISSLRAADSQVNPEVSREFLEIAESEADRLARLVDDLLTATEIERGQVTLAPAPTDLVGLVRETIAEFEGRSSRHALQLDAAEPEAVAEVDAMRMRQVLANLLDNAIKYSPAGGNVHVSVRANAHHVEIAVRDEGIGIASEALDQLFDAFFRAAPRPDSSIRGSGLGLAVVKGIVEAHGGKVDVESSVGAGSTFTVQIPAS